GGEFHFRLLARPLGGFENTSGCGAGGAHARARIGSAADVRMFFISFDGLRLSATTLAGGGDGRAKGALTAHQEVRAAPRSGSAAGTRRTKTSTGRCPTIRRDAWRRSAQKFQARRRDDLP